MYVWNVFWENVIFLAPIKDKKNDNAETSFQHYNQYVIKYETSIAVGMLSHFYFKSRIGLVVTEFLRDRRRDIILLCIIDKLTFWKKYVKLKYISFFMACKINNNVSD